MRRLLLLAAAVWLAERPAADAALREPRARDHAARDFKRHLKLERRWAPGQIAETHTHPFDAQALVTEGEMWLTCGGETRHLHPGDTFHVPQGMPHSERYGPQGATYWVARRNSR